MHEGTQAGPGPAVAAAEISCRLHRPDGAEIAYRVRRSPAAQGAVLMLHGVASNLTRYGEYVATSALAASHDLVRVDLRGHGGSITRRRIGSAIWCDDLLAVLADAGHARAVVVGHSLGAQLALQFAARHPRACTGLVLVDPLLRPALRGRWRLLAAAWPLVAIAAAVVRGVNALGLHRGSLPPRDLQALDVQARQALGSPAEEAAFVRAYSSARADLRHVPLAVYLQDLAELFRPVPDPRALGVPVLALLSTAATFADPARTRALLAAPQVALRSIECHHWPLTERPEAVREAIDGWVAALPAVTP